MRLPLVPLFARGLGASTVDVGMINAGFMLAAAALALPLGLMSDRLGRRRLILAGMGISCLTSLFLLVARTPLHVGLIYLFSGVGLACFSPAMMSHVGDSSPPNFLGRAYGWYTSALYLGMALGPGFGGAVATKGFGIAFAVSAAIIGAGVIVAGFRVGSPAPPVAAALRERASPLGLRRDHPQPGRPGLLGRHLLLDLRVGVAVRLLPPLREGPRDLDRPDRPHLHDPGGRQRPLPHPDRPLTGPDGEPALVHPLGERPVRDLHRPHRDGAGAAAALPSLRRRRRHDGGDVHGGRRRPVGIGGHPRSGIGDGGVQHVHLRRVHGLRGHARVRDPADGVHGGVRGRRTVVRRRDGRSGRAVVAHASRADRALPAGTAVVPGGAPFRPKRRRTPGRTRSRPRRRGGRSAPSRSGCP